jgi:hypothetical protein
VVAASSATETMLSTTPNASASRGLTVPIGSGRREVRCINRSMSRS